MADISWTGAVVVTNGPRFTINRKLSLEAYDHVTVEIAAGAADQEVQVQPGGSGLVSFLMISAASYDPPLTYKVNDATADSVTLDELQLFAGAGAISLIADPPPTSLFFSNSGSDPVVVEILAGRDSTP